MSIVMPPLENALRFWEDFFFTNQLSYRALSDVAYREFAQVQIQGLDYRDLSQEGPVLHYHELRTALLNAPIIDFDPKFMGSQAVFGHLGSVRLLPAALHAWSRHSRRIFHLTAELQFQLQFTSLKDVTWEEVGFPFESFLINLSVPIRDDQSRLYGAILYAPLFDGGVGREIHLIPKDLEEFEPTSLAERRELEQLLRRKRYRLFQRKYGKWIRRLHKVEPWPVLRIHGGSDRSLVTDIRYQPNPQASSGPLSAEQVASVTDYAKNILVGMCLYFKTLPVGSAHRSDWKPGPRPSSPQGQLLISSQSQVCEVTGDLVLSATEREVLADVVLSARTGRELPWHPRMGTWRRPPGFGSIPNYPRTVWQRPTWVRRDRMLEGHLPGGAVMVVRERP